MTSRLGGPATMGHLPAMDRRPESLDGHRIDSATLHWALTDSTTTDVVASHSALTVGKTIGWDLHGPLAANAGPPQSSRPKAIPRLSQLGTLPQELDQSSFGSHRPADPLVWH